MQWNLEVVPVPVSNLDRAKAFYANQVGFTPDLDIWISDTTRIVQLTPPGSTCSIHLSTVTMPPGSLQGLQLVVPDINTAHTELTERGVEVSPVTHFENGEKVDGPGGAWNSFLFFNDPDGNSWVVQERPTTAE